MKRFFKKHKFIIMACLNGLIISVCLHSLKPGMPTFGILKVWQYWVLLFWSAIFSINTSGK